MNIKYTTKKVITIVINQFKIAKRYLKIKRRKVLQYPSVIQLPITYLCNFDCVMCGMHHMIKRKDFTATELRTILSDKLFSKVKSVGVNGGEPFLKKDLVDCIQVMADVLPELNEINFISNGFFTDRIVTDLKKIKSICEERNIRVHISFSVDGIDDMQDFHRGKKKAFENVDKTIKKIYENSNQYIDSMNVICTITKYNIYRINEVEAWAKKVGIDVAYNIATVNVRIENEDRVEDFSIFSDEEARMLAQEFFYYKYLETDSERFFAIFLFCKEKRRFSDCPCMYNEWITLTPDTQIGFCATHSKNLGSALTNSAYKIVSENQEYLVQLKSEFCSTCSHYMYSLNTEGYRIYLNDKFSNKFMK